MTVVLTQNVEGLNAGADYTGAREAWLLAEGYAKQAGYDANVAAVITGTVDAVNVVTGGNLVVQVRGDVVTVAIATADTPAAAATKIDTALTGKADAAIVGGKLKITSTATGYDVTSKVVSGTGTVVANLGLTSLVGTVARGNDGGVGTANQGPADVAPGSNPTFDATRGNIATGSSQPAAATNTGLTTKAYPAATKHFVGARL